MVSGRQKALILALVFIAALVIGMMGSPEGRATDRQGSAISAASLPVMCFAYGDTLINPLCGSFNPATDTVAGDSVYPFTEDDLHLTVHLIDGAVRPQSASYELRDEDGDRLIERGSVTAFSGARSDRSFEIDLRDILDKDTYYRLILTVELPEGPVRYATRVIKLSDPETLPMLAEYAVGMHKAFFTREEGRAYAAKLETDARQDKDTLAYVNIRGSLYQVTWGDAQITPVSEAYLTIEAIQENYAYFHFDYLVRADVGDGLSADLKVSEAMTLQRDRKAVYLLTYERHAAQLWHLMENAILPSGLLLGVQEEENLSQKKSKNGQITAFSVAGMLYAYDAEAASLTRVFGFGNEGEHELRTLLRDTALKIMSVSDNGDIEFAVYGYLSGGLREGQTGIIYCFYNAEEKEIEERMFLSSDKRAEDLKREVETLFMTGNDHFLYFCFDDQVFVMDFSSGETAMLVAREEIGSLVINETGTAFAWQSGADPAFPKAVRVVDLSAGASQSIEAPEGESICTLGFIREDLIVGLSRDGIDVRPDGPGETRVYYALEIYSPKLEKLHRYEFEDTRINGIEIDDEKVTIHRFRLQNERYRYADNDVMLRGDGSSSPTSPFVNYKHPTLMRTQVLSLAKLPSYLRIAQSSIGMYRVSEELSLPDSGAAAEAAPRYLAYGKGELIGIFDTAGKAVAAAGECYGYVLRSDGTLLWCWSVRKESAEISPSETGLVGRAENLSGASFRELYYYLNKGIPVLWSSPEYGSRWIIGYEWQNAILYDPDRGRTYRADQETFAEMIGRENNYLWTVTEEDAS